MQTTVAMNQREKPDADLAPGPTTLVDPARLPVIIGEQVDALNTLDKTVKTTLAKAHEARNAAASAKEHSAGLFKKGAAIEALQLAGYSLSQAVVSSAEAQKLGFEFQAKLAEITKHLFILGVSSIAQNRMVVRELELKLKGGSSSALSDLARKEVLNVVAQLKAQEDLLNKQERLAARVRAHDDQLEIQIGKDVEHDVLLREQAEKDRQHDQILEQQRVQDAAHDELIRMQAEKDLFYEGLLQQQTQKDEQHDSTLESLTERCIKLEHAVSAIQKHQVNLHLQSQRRLAVLQKQEDAISHLQACAANAAHPYRRKIAATFVMAILALIGTLVLLILRFS